jgi:hypothetical protein
MRKVFFFIFLMGTVFGQTNPTLYVASLKGLSLREGPSKESKKVELLPYGKQITNYVVPEGKSTTIDGYNGKWINILSNEGKSYYVFDGYTLPFKVPVKDDLLSYLTEIFGKISNHDSVVIRTVDDYKEVKHIFLFSSGVKFSRTYYYEAHEFVLENLDLSVQKAYLFYYLLEEKTWYGYHLLEKIDYPTKQYTSDTLNIELNWKNVGDLSIDKTNGGVSYVFISTKNGKTTITWGGGV